MYGDQNKENKMRVLIIGWFSFKHMGNSAGDVIARDLVCGWLAEAGIDYKVAVADPFPYPNGVKWENEDPAEYTDLVFVCGPLGNGWPVTELFSKYDKCRLSAVNVSLMKPLEEWNPFVHLYERDSSAASNPDITFYATPSRVPVVGVILISGQDEYEEKDHHKQVHKIIDQFLISTELSVVRIDTAFENNEGGLRTAKEVESLISKMDVVITTRLHGTVLSLKNGIPVIPVDPVDGGAKITEQLKVIDWPILIQTGNLDLAKLKEAFTYCLGDEAKQQAQVCAKKAFDKVDQIRKKFIKDMQDLSKQELINNG